MKSKSVLMSMLLVIATGLAFVSCSKNEGEFTESDEFITIPFCISANIETSFEELSTRTEDKKEIYAIQVFEYSKNTNTLLPYAHGVFDDISQLSIKVKKSCKYKINVGLYYNFFDQYKFGSLRSDSYYKEANNIFVYSQDWIFTQLNPNLSTGHDTFYRLSDSEASRSIIECDTYTGILDNYVAQEDASIEMELVRSSFGVKINIEGLTEGKIVWTGRAITAGVGYNDSFEICSIEYPNNTYENIFSIAQFMRQISEGQSNYIEFTLDYYDTNNNKTILSTSSFGVCRNKRTVINITLTDNSQKEFNQSFSISKSTGNMEDEEISFDFEIN